MFSTNTIFWNYSYSSGYEINLNKLFIFEHLLHANEKSLAEHFKFFTSICTSFDNKLTFNGEYLKCLHEIKNFPLIKESLYF